jgi:plastocyanin
VRKPSSLPAVTKRKTLVGPDPLCTQRSSIIVAQGATDLHLRMWTKLVSGVFLGAALVAAADIRGTIIIERRLTRHNVTPSAGMYQRGVAVELGEDGEGDPLAFERSHVAVYLEGGPRSIPSGVVNASIEQMDRRFVPDLVVIPAGSIVSFPNFDPIFHNVFSLSKAKSFDLGNYPQGQTRTVTFSAHGVIAVYCHLHSNMAATIVVAPNRWAAQADGHGVFALKGVPPGTYTVVAWHKTAGTLRKTVTISEKNDAEISFTLPYVDSKDVRPIAHR